MSDSVLDVINGIKDTTIEWKKSLDIANDKSLKAIEYGFQKLLDKTNFYRKDIVKLKAEWELIKKEVGLLLSYFDGQREVVLSYGDIALLHKGYSEETVDNILQALKAIESKDMKIAELEVEVEELKQGICEHVKKNELSNGCKLCELAIAEKGYPLWIKKAKDLQTQLDKLLMEVEEKEKDKEIITNKLIVERGYAKQLQAQLAKQPKLSVDKVMKIIYDNRFSSNHIDTAKALVDAGNKGELNDD